MIRELLARGEIAVIGLGRSGIAVSRLLQREGARVYASDSGSDAAVVRDAQALRTGATGGRPWIQVGGAAGGRPWIETAGEAGTHEIEVQTGGHDLQRIARAAAVVVSPGVPPGVPPLVAARNAEVPIVSEVEAALAYLPRIRLAAVTGTNGKTTVTALIDHLLRALGRDSVAAGNIGTALSEIALRDVPPEFVALELSSFQLHDTPGLKPEVGVMTNLAPDHLDRYTSVAEYYADKELLFRNATATTAWVTNADDPEVARRVAHVLGMHLTFSLADPRATAGPAKSVGRWRLFDHDLIGTDEIPLIGVHNVANVLAASLAVCALVRLESSATVQALAAGIRSFRPLPNRLELVADSGGVRWINDSKATNVSSARVAIEGMTGPTIVLLGGKHKGEPYTPLIPSLRAHAKVVIAYGQSAPLIEADLRDYVPLERLGSSFEEVMMRARAVAVPGDTVLLSPACSSYDMFANYEERGALFRRLASEA